MDDSVTVSADASQWTGFPCRSLSMYVYTIRSDTARLCSGKLSRRQLDRSVYNTWSLNWGHLKFSTFFFGLFRKVEGSERTLITEFINF